MYSRQLLFAAKDLVSAMDKVTKDNLPEKIARTVKFHSRMAVVLAIIPIPVIDLLVAALNIWAMYFKINSRIGMKFGESLMKTIVSAVLTNLTSSVVFIVLAELIKLIPVIGIIGFIFECVALYGVTLASGFVYIKAITAMMKKEDIVSGTKLKNSLNEFMREYKS